MSRFIQKRGFSLNETLIVIVILGCIAACAIGAFNMSKINNETLAAKQAKLESALKTATMSIIGQDKISTQTACNAETMRDKYADKLSGATPIDNVIVNGVSVPALEVKDYGIVAFEASDDCQTAWYATGATPQNGAANMNSPADIDKALEIYTQIVPDMAKAENPKTGKIEIVFPDRVTANSPERAKLAKKGGYTSSSAISANAVAYNVSSSGYAYLYGATSTSLAAASDNSKYNHNVSICEVSGYSYFSTACNVNVAFYEKINEQTCQKSFCPGNGRDSTTDQLVTTGMVNNACRSTTGAPASCSCPNSQPYMADVSLIGDVTGACLSADECTELGMEISGSTCSCPDDAPWSNVYRRCVRPGECAYEYLDPENNCECKSESEIVAMDGYENYYDVCEEWVNNPTEACKRVKDNWDKSTGTCACIDPYGDPTRDCACLSPRSRQNGTCQCDRSLVTLTGEEVFSATSATCKYDCAVNGLIANDDKTACVSPNCGNELQSYDISVGRCVCDASKVSPLTVGSDEVFDSSSATCKSCRNANRTYNANNVCVCKPKAELNLAANEIYDTNLPGCVYTCKDGAVANADHTQCIGDCLEYYDYPTETLNCIQNPTDAKTTECLVNTNRIYDGNSPVCSSECSELTTADSTHKYCGCDRAKVAIALALPENANKIFALNAAPNCMAACTGQTIPNADRTACVPVDCMHETTDNATQHCIPNPTEQDAACLTGNLVADPTSPTCSRECDGLTSANTNHLTCACDEAKVTAALARQENKNKIYDLDNAPVCMMACQGQTFPNDTQTACRPVDCLYETTDNITQHCIANPSDELTAACLRGTNNISSPTANSCSTECTGVTSPNSVHKVCACDQAKVATALALPENAGKIYALDDAPICMAQCPAGTFVSEDRTRCIQVDCLKETTDNITQHCIARPTDERTTLCLQGTNYVSDPANPTDCRVDCGNRKSPNSVYKQCVCDLNKMKANGLFTSDNYKFDAQASNCESPCPSSFTYRDPDDPTGTTCRCPRLKPAAVTVQAGYFYHAGSTVLTGATACQLECPTVRVAIDDWITLNSRLFTENPKLIYSYRAVGCVTECEGNYVPSDDKLECICGITANNCQAGTYFDGDTCECKPCPVGHYCPGPVPPINCPCGTYGSTTGLATDACSGDCPAGYYCPEASVAPRAHACPAGYTCPQGHGPQYCEPRPCTFPATSDPTSVVCNKCQTEAQIRAAQPNYFGENEIYSTDLSAGCKQCKSNMVYDSTGKCVCPSDKPYWDGTQCTPCKAWGTLLFARQSSQQVVTEGGVVVKDPTRCTLYEHMMGKKGYCYDLERVPTQTMKAAANALSQADKARTFNGVYAYMVSYKDGKATVEGVFTARSWYNTFGADLSSKYVGKNASIAQNASCTEVCGGNAECVSTCNYMKGKVTQNTMFQHCVYAVNNQWYGQSAGNEDELCTGGQITVVQDNQQCVYGVDSVLRNVISPLVLDLKGDGFKYTSVDDGVIFDLNNDGVAEQAAWTKEQKEFDNAFLVLDKNGNGQVDNGGELFGDQNGAENGFLELAKYDDNGDRLITKDDKVYKDLRLWVDFNKNARVDYEADGTTQELKTLEEAGVTELSVDFKVQKDAKGNVLRDIYGNITGFIGSFKMMIQNAFGKLEEVVRQIMDVFFVTK